MDKVKRNNKTITLLFSIGLIMLVIGFSYAFFFYSKTGLYTHTINGGQMKVIYDETTGDNITIENAYPLNDEEALTKSLEFEFTITGYNESDKNVYYAIEMDYGEDGNKIRFKDTDIKLSMFENDELVIENEIYQNLDNQDIYYGTLWRGTSSESSIVNNYKMRIWINDNVIISDTIENTISSWDDMDWRLIEDKLDSDELERINNNEITSLSELGISIYTSEEFMNHYANFKVNIRADLTYDDVGNLMYDANGGTSTFTKSSLTTNMITTKKPVMENMGFLGWSTDPNATEPEYYAGDSYSGEGQMLYAVYTATRNVMVEKFPTTIQQQAPYITEIHFINDTNENIDIKYNNATIKSDLTYDNQGRVLGWLENDYYDEENSQQYYKVYIGSEGTTYLKNGYYLFSHNDNNSGIFFLKVNKITFSNVDTSMVTNMSNMFHRCISLNELDLSSFNTSKVENMSDMFSGLSYWSMDMQLRAINVSDFDTSKVTDMSYMFSHCISLANVDISNFDTKQVTDMSGMFNCCNSLEKIDVSSFETSNVTSMRNMFSRCSSIKNINVSSFDTSKVVSMDGMFHGCGKISELDLSVFDTGNVRYFGRTDVFDGMFSRCYSLVNLNISNFNTSKAINMSWMFNSCQNLTELNIDRWDTSQVTNMSWMFSSCKLTTFNIDKFDTSLVTDMSCMFWACSNLKEINLSNFDTSNVLDLSSMFSYCSEIISLDLSSFDIGKVTDISSMFYGCSNLEQLNINNFDFTNVTVYNSIFTNINDELLIYVKDETAQNWILNLPSTNRPSSWSTSNIIIKSMEA